MTELRPELQHFAIRMERKLKANDHKAHWRGITDVDYFLDRMQQEYQELIDAVCYGTPEEIADEAADIGNFAMMIADRATLPCDKTERGANGL